MAAAGKLKYLVIDELTQLYEEGFDVDIPAWKEKIEKIDDKDRESLLDIYRQLFALPKQKYFKYNEPSKLDEIFAQSDVSNLPEESYKDIDLDYFHGAWLGRCVGCALGQPCEGWKSQRIVEWYKNADKYPINSYLPTVSGNERNEGLATDELIKGMPIDDDIRFTVLNYLLVKEKGLHFDSWDVGMHWLRRIPLHVIFTAEAQAYLNFANHDEAVMWEKPKNAMGIFDMAKINSNLNPYREWIGAQIRADAFGYLAPGMPKLAATMAYNDAYFSHVKNGIYGEMFFAALISAAFVEKDLDKCFQTALAVIPKNSRFYEEAVYVNNLAQSDILRDELRDILVERAEKYHPVHTINNAAFCIGAIMRYKNDFSGAVAFSVECGLDTDCNGATVGSVMGALLGKKNIPDNWRIPLMDKFDTGVHPYNQYSIEGFAKEIKALNDKIHK